MLVNNAGVFLPAPGKTAQGLDLQIGTNHVGVVYLTQLLLPLLRAGKPSRCALRPRAALGSCNAQRGGRAGPR